MSAKRDTLVANEALRRVGEAAGLTHYMRAIPFEPRGVLAARHHHAPPVGATGAVQPACASDEVGEPWAERSREVRGKRVADCVEALVGAHVAHVGDGQQGQGSEPSTEELAASLHDALAAALGFCVGLGVLPPEARKTVPQLLGVQPARRDQAGERSAAAAAAAPMSVREVAGIRAAEAALGYSFRDPAHARRALTHVSWPSREQGRNYQLTEFLGDAVLGLLVSVYVYRTGGSPGQMTEERSRRVSNEALASACVAANLHAYVLVRQRQSLQDIAAYAAAQQEAGGTAAAVPLMPPAGGVKAGDGPGAVAHGAVRAPKLLADVVEALVGAVFLDSGGDLAAAERAINRLGLARSRQQAARVHAMATRACTRRGSAPSRPVRASHVLGVTRLPLLGRAVAAVRVRL